MLAGAVSRLTHGSAGTFDVNLPLSGAPGIESRNVNGSYTIVLTFDRPVISGTATLAAGVGTVGALPTFSGNTATVQLSGVADRQTITVELDNVVGVTGLTEKVFVAMSVLVGDVNQNGAVTSEDIELIRVLSGNVANSGTFKRDLNVDGVVNSADITAVRRTEGDGASLFPDFAFTGHYYHARSGLYLAPGRIYSPSLGRWISRDPIGESGGINLYGYVGNNPTKLTDPLGLCPGDWLDLLYQFMLGSEEGAYASIDAAIPFWDPFSDRYNPNDLGIGFSKIAGGTGIGILATAGIGELFSVAGRSVEGAASLWDATSLPQTGRYLNVATNVTAGEFEANLISNGFTAARGVNSSGNAVSVLTNNGASTYTIYTATSTGGPSAQVLNTAGKIVIKYRLGGP